MGREDWKSYSSIKINGTTNPDRVCLSGANKKKSGLSVSLRCDNEWKSGSSVSLRCNTKREDWKPYSSIKINGVCGLMVIGQMGDGDC
jgi:hypothetical protein